MTDEEFARLFEIPHELSGVEFKGPGKFSDPGMRAEVVRAILGMANRRDGGLIVIGVKTEPNSPVAVGLTGDELQSWNHDHICDMVAKYADPSVEFTTEEHGYGGRKYILIVVRSFSDIPVLCKRDLELPNQGKILRAGACYVRTRRKPETMEIPGQTEMRDLLDLATERRLRQFLSTMRGAGLELPAEDAGFDLMEEQVRFLDKVSLVSEIKSRGYWQVLIAPGTLRGNLVSDISMLYPLVSKVAVDLRGGWEFPVLTDHPAIGDDYIECGAQAFSVLNFWRMYQTLCFHFVGSIPTDWLDQAQAPPGWVPGRQMPVADSIKQLLEVFQFAASLAATNVLNEVADLEIRVSVGPLSERKLSDPSRLPLLRPIYTSHASKFVWNARIPKSDLIGNARSIALEQGRQLLLRFGWDPGIEMLESIVSDRRL